MQARRPLGIAAALMLSATLVAAQGSKPATQSKPATPPPSASPAAKNARPTAKPADTTHRAMVASTPSDSARKTGKSQKARARKPRAKS